MSITEQALFMVGKELNTILNKIKDLEIKLDKVYTHPPTIAEPFYKELDDIIEQLNKEKYDKYVVRNYVPDKILSKVPKALHRDLDDILDNKPFLKEKLDWYDVNRCSLFLLYFKDIDGEFLEWFKDRIGYTGIHRQK
jgi:hypothetical protein